MNSTPRLHGKKILVLGLGISGIAACRLCLDRGAKVVGLDRKREEELDRSIPFLRQSGARILLGTDLTGENFDLVICSPGIPQTHPMVEQCRKKGISLFGEIELASWFYPGPIIAVTGTDGKSTVVSLIYQILSDQGKSALAVGNIGYPFSQQILDQPPNKATFSIVEVSSYQLELVSEFHPHIAIILNIAPDHLSRHGSLEEYANAKYQITRNQTSEDFLIRPLVLPGSFHSESENLFWASQSHELPGIQFETTSNKLTVRYPGKDWNNLFPGLGRLMPHQLENALAALSLCLPLDLDLTQAVQSVLSFPGLPHRLEYLGKWSGVSYYNDSKATNVHSCRAAIEAIDSPIILLAGGLRKKEDYSVLVPQLKQKAKLVIVFGEAREMLQEVWRKEIPLLSVPTLEQATRMAIDRANPGDTVLLSPACASQDRFQNFEQRGNFFKSLVTDWVTEKNHEKTD